MMSDVVVVSSDMSGNNTLMSALKFNRLVSALNARHYFNKNRILVRDVEMKDALIVSDCHGNSTIKTMDEINTASDEERNVFMEVLHRVHSEKNQASIDCYLEHKRKSLQDKLEMATSLYVAKNYLHALEQYSGALSIIESDNYPDEFRLQKDDVFRIKYALVLCHIAVHMYGPLKTACEMLNTLILTYGSTYPALYYTLGQAKVKLNLYESARISLEMGVSVLDECTVLARLTFPASSHVIPDTDPDTLRDKFQSALQLCSNVPRPDVRCCYRLCIADSKAIYFNSPNFIGYVNVTCSERCHLNYHRACWKFKLKTDRIKKPSCILKQQCQTDDCSGVVKEIKIYDQHLKVNAAMQAKDDGEYTAADYRAGRRSEVVESRVYKAQFHLPNPMIRGSNLKLNAPAFTPGTVSPVTLHLKNPTKTGPLIFHGMDAEETGANINREDVKIETGSSKPNSNLQINVLDFVPEKIQAKKDDTKIKKDTVKIANCITARHTVQSTERNGKQMKEEVKNDNNLSHSKTKEEKVKTDTQSKLAVNVQEFSPVKTEINKVRAGSKVTERVKTDSNIGQSKLNVDVPEFLPSQVESQVKEEVTDFKIKEPNIDSNVPDLNIKEPNIESNIRQSILSVDVPEFLPSQTTPDTEISLTKWSTNAESTLDSCENASNYEQPTFQVDNNTVPSEWPIDTALVKLANYYTNIKPQTAIVLPPATSPASEPSIIETEHNILRSNPVATHSIASQCHVDTSSAHTQTDVKLLIEEVKALKCQINNLQYALYEAEERNNQLLLRYKYLHNVVNHQNTTDSCTQTQEIIDKRQKNCVKWIHGTCTSSICHADVLQTTNQKLEEQIKELKISLRLERDCFHECKLKYCNEITSLKNNISDVETKLAAVQNEYSEYKTNNTVMEVNKILLEQIQSNKKFYLPYLKSFEDKCKHMIWELEDIYSMTTPDATPSKPEIEHNLNLWRAALAQVEEHQITIKNNYETLLTNITSQHAAEFQLPAQNLFVEPPNIMLRYFKPMLIANRRLEPEQTNSFYRILNSSHLHNLVVQYNSTENRNEPTSEPVNQNGNNTVAEKPTPLQPANTNMTGATPKLNKTRQSRSVLEPDTVAPNVQPKAHAKRAVPDVVGLDALIQKLQNQFPLTDDSLLSEALFSIRGRHGGLTGMSSKEIVAAVKRYIRERQRTSTNINTPATTTLPNPWSTINTPVQWHNDNQDRNCTICFDYMSHKSSVRLKCQHVFHSKCIKIWLHSNSICPICRSFTTLDDEFPPLK